MPKEKELGSRMNGLFRFNEKDHVQGFYKGVQPIKNGEAILLSTLDGSKTVGIPNYTTIKDVTSKLAEGDFVCFMYKGEEKSKSGYDYMNIAARAWELEESELQEWDKKCNVAEVLDLMPDYQPDPDDVGSKAGKEESSISDDELPF